MKPPKNAALFILSLLLVCLTKKLGFFIALPSVLMLLAYARSDARTIVLIAAATICLNFFLLSPMATRAFNATPSGPQEALSVPLMQTARTAYEHPQDITAEERERIDGLLRIQDLANRYNGLFADDVKTVANGKTIQSYLDWAKAWAVMSVKYPKTYIAAILNLNAGWFALTKYTILLSANWHNQLNESVIPEGVLLKHGIHETISSLLQETYNSLYRMPLIGLLLSMGFYATLIPAWVLSSVLSSRGSTRINFLLILIPIGLSILLGMWAAPVSVSIEATRYVQPVIYSIPILASIALEALNNQVEQKRFTRA